MARRDDVLAALVSAAPDSVSGEVLAGELGISRVAVGKHVAALRQVGYSIGASAGTGYQLLDRPDLPVAPEVVPLLQSTLWTEVSDVAETASTNDDLKRAARRGAPHGSVLLAGRQASGRGRLGRSWSSPTGGVYASMLLRPQMALFDLASLPLVVGVGVAWALESLGMDGVALKWPNDVWLRSRKVAGVLIESSAEADSVEWVVIGVGLNVRRSESYPEDVAYLHEQSRVGVAEAAAALLDGVANAWERLTVEGFESLRAEWEKRSALDGRAVRVFDREGVERYAGKCTGVDEIGRLLLETPDGVVAVAAGDVSLSTPAR